MQPGRICFILIVLFVCAASGAPVFSQNGEETEIYQLVNVERTRSRLTPLAWDHRLGQIARSHSRKMAREGFFSHHDRSGGSVADRSRHGGVGYWRKIGENLFMMTDHPQIASASVRGWMRSPGHRQNIRDRAWTATGIGIAKSRDGRIYVTQVFVAR